MLAGAVVVWLLHRLVIHYRLFLLVKLVYHIPASRAQTPLPLLSTFTDPPGLSEEQRKSKIYGETVTIPENRSLCRFYLFIFGLEGFCYL